jgi:hypothetical protein
MSLIAGKEKPAKKVAEEINAKKAQEFLKKERTERATSAKAEIDAVLSKYNCELIGRPIYTPSNQGGYTTAASIDLIPK